MNQDQEATPPSASELRSWAEKAEQEASEALKRGDTAIAESAIERARLFRATAEQEDRISAMERALGIQAKE